MGLKIKAVILTASIVIFSSVTSRAAGSGNATHTALKYGYVEIQAHLPGYNGQCGFANGTVAIYDRDIKVGNSQSKINKWAYVKLAVDHCQGPIVTYVGSIALADSEFQISIPTPNHGTWSALVQKSLTVRNQADKTDTMAVTLSLSWSSVDILHHSASNTKAYGEILNSAQSWWRPANLTGEMSAASSLYGSLQFDLATQLRTRIVDTQTTVHQ